MMTRQEIKDYLNTDIEFIYNGKGAAFCPIEVYVVGYDNEGIGYDTLDEVMDAKVFDGKSIVITIVDASASWPEYFIT